MAKMNSKLSDCLTLLEFRNEFNKRYLLEALGKAQEYEQRGFSDAYIIGYLRGTCLTLLEFRNEFNKRYLLEALAKAQEYEQRGFSDAYIIGYLKGTIKSIIQNLENEQLT